MEKPSIGQKWVGQGGIRAAAEIPATDGSFYDLVVVTDANDKPVVIEDVEYGYYGTEVPGASNYTDGRANANALLSAGDGSPLVNKACGVVTVDGQTDCYPPSIGEQQIIRATCPGLLPDDLYLSSTQDGANYARSQRFEDGHSSWHNKDRRLSAFVVRRVPC